MTAAARAESAALMDALRDAKLHTALTEARTARGRACVFLSAQQKQANAGVC